MCPSRQTLGRASEAEHNAFFVRIPSLRRALAYVSLPHAPVRKGRLCNSAGEPPWRFQQSTASVRAGCPSTRPPKRRCGSQRKRWYRLRGTAVERGLKPQTLNREFTSLRSVQPLPSSPICQGKFSCSFSPPPPPWPSMFPLRSPIRPPSTAGSNADAHAGYGIGLCTLQGQRATEPCLTLRSSGHPTAGHTGALRQGR